MLCIYSAYHTNVCQSGEGAVWRDFVHETSVVAE